MRIPGLKSLKLSARWLRSRFIDGALILGYHRIAEVARDPYSICVTPQHFAEQLEVLHRYAQPIALRELVQRLRDGNLPRRAVSLTFDDGYGDNLYCTKPLLERYSIPATVFVATGYLGGEFWWDELERILLSPLTLPGRLSLSIDGSFYEWVLSDIAHMRPKQEPSSSRHALLLSLHKRLLPLSSIERQRLMAQLWAWAGAESAELPYCRAMTAAELIELATGGLVDIGAHSVTHPVLSRLSIAEQRSEIQQSKAYLKELLGCPVTSFAYPNGSTSEATVAAVKEAGFTCACASYNDVAWSGSNRFYLPRFWIPNWDGTTFSRWLAMWLCR
jgi:peptidoglycan/xylan/chitin deacetylase (PgdA/CDA1 family)